MIPILFDSKATSFTTNGIGRLSDAASCKVTEERNGAYELEMEYPIGGIHFNEIKNSSIILAKPFQNGTLQAFRVYKVQRKARDLAGIYARHISYQLSFIPVSVFTSSTASGALSGLKSHAAESCPFTFSTDITRAGSFVMTKPDSIRSLLGGQEGSVLDTYHGEYEWDNYTVKLHEARGSDKGVVIRYGKNLIDLEQEENIENTITGIYPFWQKEQSNYDADNEAYVKATTYVELSEKIIRSSNASNFPFQRTEVKDFTQIFDEAPSEAELRAYTNQYIKENEIGVPKVNLDVKFVNLFETPEYASVSALQTVNLCDTVTVIFENLGVNAKSKVIKTEYDVLKERYESIELGDAKSTLSSTVNSINDGLEYVMYKPDPLSLNDKDVRTMIDRATGVLDSGTGGHVIINRNSKGWANEILFLDNDNIASAKNVLRINMSGIGFSTTGYKGPYYQSWTNDGHLTLGGINNRYGTLEIMDEKALPMVFLDKDGLKLLAIDYVGYLYNNAFYTDGNHTNLIKAAKYKSYYNYSNSKLYKWDGKNYVTDSDSGVIAKMTHDGLDIKRGTIELLMDEEVGFSVDGDEIHLGDFYISKSNRQMLQSVDEMTGISAKPKRNGQLYLWAAWKNSNDYGLVVNTAGAYAMTSDREDAYHIADTLRSLLNGGSGSGGCSSYSSGGCRNYDCDDSCYTPSGDPNECRVCSEV